MPTTKIVIDFAHLSVLSPGPVVTPTRYCSLLKSSFHIKPTQRTRVVNGLLMLDDSLEIVDAILLIV